MAKIPQQQQFVGMTLQAGAERAAFLLEDKAPILGLRFHPGRRADGHALPSFVGQIWTAATTLYVHYSSELRVRVRDKHGEEHTLIKFDLNGRTPNNIVRVLAKISDHLGIDTAYYQAQLIGTGNPMDAALPPEEAVWDDDDDESDDADEDEDEAPF